jgi:phosphoribosyl 1,2-cyclic phosphodiesterase
MLPSDRSLNVAGLRITPFETPHDSRQCYGYRIDSEDGRSLAMTTDLGYLPDSVLQTILGCQMIHIESNHDPEMLRNGPYPYWLIQRIRGEGGHLSNQECAAVLPTLVKAGANRIVLAHLSEHNNTPALARECAAAALTMAGASVGRDCLLSVAKPTDDSPVIYF